MVKKVFVIVLIFLMIVLSGCVIEIDGNSGFRMNDKNMNIQIKPGVSVKTGELRTFTQEYDLEGQEELDVNMSINAADVTIEKSENKLFEGEIRTDIIGLEPNITLGGNKLRIRDDFSHSGISNFTNDWDLKITSKIPVDLTVNNNASKNNLDLTGIKLNNIDLNFNAADTNIRFDEKNEGDLRRFKLEVNAGNTDIFQLGNAGAKEIDVRINAGKASLEFGSNIYNDVDIAISANAGKVILAIPDNVGVRLIKRGTLSSIDINKGGFERKNDDEYVSSNYDSAEYKINIDINGTASNVTIR